LDNKVSEKDIKRGISKTSSRFDTRSM